MDIFVASTSPHKITASEEAGQDVFPDNEIKIEGKKTKSGVNAQPETKKDDDETLRGACNRLDDLKKIIGKTRYDLLIAFENGIFSINIEGRTAWFDFGWVVVEDINGQRYYAHSPGIEIDADIVDAARQRGFETTTIGDIIAEQTGSNPTDPHSDLTSNAVKRSDMLEDSLKIILGQLLRTISIKTTKS